MPSDVPLTVEQRILEAAARLPAGGMVTGWVALRLAGASWFDGLAADGRTCLPVLALLPHASRIRGAGIEVTRTRPALPEAAVSSASRARRVRPRPRRVPLAEGVGDAAGLGGGPRVPRPLMNRQVLDLSGRVIAVVDLLDEQSGTYGEYNGASHRSRERQRRDEARAHALRGVGLEGFVLVAGDSERVWRERMASPDAEEAALDTIMLEHYRSLG